jgi:hypothetical protein
MAVGYSLGSVLLAKYLAEADNGLYTRTDQKHEQHPQQQQQQTSAAAAAAAGDSSSSSGSDGQAPAAAPLRGSGLVGAALVSPPVCLHSTNNKMGKPNSMKFMYNLAVAYKCVSYCDLRILVRIVSRRSCFELRVKRLQLFTWCPSSTTNCFRSSVLRRERSDCTCV